MQDDVDLFLQSLHAWICNVDKQNMREMLSQYQLACRHLRRASILSGWAVTETCWKWNSWLNLFRGVYLLFSSLSWICPVHNHRPNSRLHKPTYSLHLKWGYKSAMHTTKCARTTTVPRWGYTKYRDTE